jgi:hypothetical protein
MSLVPPEVQMTRALAIAYHRNEKVTGETVNHYASALHSESPAPLAAPKPSLAPSRKN